MGVVNDIYTAIDVAVDAYAEGIFTAAAGPLLPVVAALGTIGLVVIGLNMVLQMIPMGFSSIIFWGVRFGIVSSYLLIWGNFSTIYHAFREVPTQYAVVMVNAAGLGFTSKDTTILNVAKAADLPSAVNEFVDGMGRIAQRFFDDVSGKLTRLGRSIRAIFFGVIITIIGIIYAAVSIVVICIAKLGFALAIGIAPLAITMLALPQTQNYFVSWCNFALGFLMMEIIMTALVMLLLMLASQMLPADGGTDFGKFLAFLMVIIGAIVLTSNIPTMASTLVSTSLGAVGVGAAWAAGGAASRALDKATGGRVAAIRASNQSAAQTATISAGVQQGLAAAAARRSRTS